MMRQRERILGYRLVGHHLDARLPPGGLLEAAEAEAVLMAPFRGAGTAEVTFTGP